MNFSTCWLISLASRLSKRRSTEEMVDELESGGGIPTTCTFNLFTQRRLVHNDLNNIYIYILLKKNIYREISYGFDIVRYFFKRLIVRILIVWHLPYVDLCPTACPTYLQKYVYIHSILFTETNSIQHNSVP